MVMVRTPSGALARYMISRSQDDAWADNDLQDFIWEASDNISGCMAEMLEREAETLEAEAKARRAVAKRLDSDVTLAKLLERFGSEEALLQKVGAITVEAPGAVSTLFTGVADPEDALRALDIEWTRVMRWTDQDTGIHRHFLDGDEEVASSTDSKRAVGWLNIHRCRFDFENAHPEVKEEEAMT